MLLLMFLLGLQRVFLGETDPMMLRPLEGETLNELIHHLIRFGYLQEQTYTGYDAQVKKALQDYCAVENFDTRVREDDQIDLEIINFMRGK